MGPLKNCLAFAWDENARCEMQVCVSLFFLFSSTNLSSSFPVCPSSLPVACMHLQCLWRLHEQPALVMVEAKSGTLIRILFHALHESLTSRREEFPWALPPVPTVFAFFILVVASMCYFLVVAPP